MTSRDAIARRATVTRPHVVVMHRRRDNHAEYAKYLDHHHCAVTYNSAAVGLASIPDNATAVPVVERTDDPPSVRTRARNAPAR